MPTIDSIIKFTHKIIIISQNKETDFNEYYNNQNENSNNKIINIFSVSCMHIIYVSKH